MAAHWQRGSAFRWSMIFAPPMSPPAGRARRWRRCFIGRWCGDCSMTRRSRCSISAALPTSHILTASELIACDTGPGNALLDDFLRLQTGAPLDTDGRMAASGAVDETMIERLLAHPFFALPPPKSLDRNAFRGWVGDTLDGIECRRRRGDADRTDCRGGCAHRCASAARRRRAGSSPAAAPAIQR